MTAKMKISTAAIFAITAAAAAVLAGYAMAGDSRDAAPAANKKVEAAATVYIDKADLKYKPSGRVGAIYRSGQDYRDMSRGDIRDTNNLTGLFCGNDGCYLKRAGIVFLDGEDECTGIKTLALNSGAAFLFSKFTGHNKGKIQSVSIYGQTMPPNKVFAFGYGNKQYELEAFGEITDSTSFDVENYSLVYSEKGASRKQTILWIKEAENRHIQLLFIGDLDGDGKPDLILDASFRYDANHIFLFLSSTAREGEYVRCEADQFASFDC